MQLLLFPTQLLFSRLPLFLLLPMPPRRLVSLLYNKVRLRRRLGNNFFLNDNNLGLMSLSRRMFFNGGLQLTYSSLLIVHECSQLPQQRL
jgi:hypothetical protein